jgi:hypothetical protein
VSLAKIVTVRRAQKDQGKCETCDTPLPAGVGYKHYSVGFRGFKRRRCLSCPDPKPSERESSKIAGVYAAQEAVDVGTITTVEDAQAVLQEFAEAVREVAQEYEDAADAMGEAGYEMQEKADVLNGAADDVENTDLSEYEADGDDDAEGDDDGGLTDEQLDALRDAVQTAVDEIELP